MPRYRLLIEYDGTPFAGWQRQGNAPSVQQTLEEALAVFCGETHVIYGAGRTDSGVHARGQVAHVDLSSATDCYRLVQSLNALVKPWPVAVLAAQQTDDDFHARFSATVRIYRYIILNRQAPPQLDRGQVWWLTHPLDADAMHAGAQELVGHHDFTSFRAAHCQSASACKTIDSFIIRREGEYIIADVSARSFLHNQVRIMMGTLCLVGQGKWNRDDVRTALVQRNRSIAGLTAPPQGLCLMAVRYG